MLQEGRGGGWRVVVAWCGVVVVWRGGGVVVAWWRGGGGVAWWRGAWWRGGVVAWWRGGVVAWWRGLVVVLMCVTVRTLCLLVSSVSVILSVARAVIHDMCT